eukprot:TRINITY_DN10294_c0_g1_i1.p1 TRINITY_DN10294_c0_g1~~TRINITY_DN10294_c0_g1_i1.p1  ORF type:complete len:648 (+),score=191.28 TRINITY_DN10294_c0_g1_i1:113-2056(+)
MNGFKLPTKNLPVKKNVTNNNTNGTSNNGSNIPSNVAFGVARGQCNQSGCDCDQYYCKEGMGGPCLQCNHFPTVHSKIDNCSNNETVNNKPVNNSYNNGSGNNPTPIKNPSPKGIILPPIKKTESPIQPKEVKPPVPTRDNKPVPPPPPPPPSKTTINKIINKSKETSSPNLNNVINNSNNTNNTNNINKLGTSNQKTALKNKSLGNLTSMIPIKQQNSSPQPISHSPPPQPTFTPSPPQPTYTPSKKGNSVCCYDFHSESDNEISMKVGDEVTVSDQSDTVWWYGTNHTTGKEGYFPADGYVTFSDTKKTSGQTLVNNINNNNNKFAMLISPRMNPTSTTSPTTTNTTSVSPISNNPPPPPPVMPRESATTNVMPRESTTTNVVPRESTKTSIPKKEKESKKSKGSGSSGGSLSVDINEEHILSDSCKFNLEHLHDKNINERIRGVKVYFMGDEECGKTKLIDALQKKEFQQNYTPTVFEIYKTETNLPCGKKVAIEYWDNSGSKKFDAKRLAIFPNVNCYVICFDLTNPESWNSVMKRHVPFISEEINNPVIIVGTKIDKMKENPSGCVSLAAVREYVTINLGNYKVARFLGVSAKKAPSIDILRDMIIYSTLYSPLYKITKSPSSLLSNPSPRADAIYNRLKPK